MARGYLHPEKCRNCDCRIEQSEERGRVRHFCSPRCRVAWNRAQARTRRREAVTE